MQVQAQPVPLSTLPIGALCWSAKKTCPVRVVKQLPGTTVVHREEEEVEAPYNIPVRNSDTYLVEVIDVPLEQLFEKDDDTEVRACGACGRLGHNRRTCTFNTKVKAENAPQRTKQQRSCSACGGKGHIAKTCGRPVVEKEETESRACGKCGEFGHNRRTCPNEEVLFKPSDDRPKTQRTCGGCGEKGHNLRTCPNK